MLSITEIRAFGLSGKQVGKAISLIKNHNLSDDEAREHLKNWGNNKDLSIQMKEDSVWHWLCHCDVFNGMGSNSEKRRWLENKSVLLNGETPSPDNNKPNVIWELVIFCKSEHKITMV